MAYLKSAGYPAERASKLNHMWFIDDQATLDLLNGFEEFSVSKKEKTGSRIFKSDISRILGLKWIVTIDGGECLVSNACYPGRSLMYFTFGGLKLDFSTIEEFEDISLPDPRDYFDRISDNLWIHGGVIPLSSIHIPGETVKETIRKAINSVFDSSGLYPTLQFLISREWDKNYVMGCGKGPHFHCRQCGKKIYVPKSLLHFLCPFCNYSHFLTDYLMVDQTAGEDVARMEIVQTMRNLCEVITLIHFIRNAEQADQLGQTLFLKDGPLMLRANLKRVVDDIRAYLRFLNTHGKIVYLVGVEKTGDVANFADAIKTELSDLGSFYLPTLRFVAENIHGYHFDEKIHRSRELFGAKVYAKVGPRHVLALNYPIGDYGTDPCPEDLVGFEEVLSSLSKLVSSQYKNALFPIVLVNKFVSISRYFSGGILDEFTSKIFQQKLPGIEDFVSS